MYIFGLKQPGNQRHLRKFVGVSSMTSSCLYYFVSRTADVHRNRAEVYNYSIIEVTLGSPRNNSY